MYGANNLTGVRGQRAPLMTMVFPPIPTAPVVLAFAGSSSPQGYLDTYTGGTPNVAIRYTDDGVNYNTLTAGRFGMEAGRIIMGALGRGVDYIRGGLGGTTLQSWEADGSSYRSALVNRIKAVGRCDILMIQVGSNDVDTGLVLATTDLQAARYRSLISKFRAETGLPNLKIVINGTQDRPNSNLQPPLIIQRHAEMTVANNDTNVYFGTSTYDLDTADGLHQNEASQIISGSRFADQAIAILTGGVQKRAMKISGVVVGSSTVTNVTILHKNGTDFTPTTAIPGFVLTDNNGNALSISDVSRTSPTNIKITHSARNAGATALLEYIPNAGDSDDTLVIHDNATRPLPLDVLEATITVPVFANAAPPTIAITNSPSTAATQGSAYNYTPTTSGGSGTQTWSITGTPPAGITFSTSNGVLSGTPTATGTSGNLQISVQDSTGTASTAVFTITVAAQASQGGGTGGTSGTATGKSSKVNFTGGQPASTDTTWTTVAGTGVALKTPTGAATGWTVAIPSAGGNNGGSTTGNNSGIYPDDVMMTYFFDTAVDNVVISGLDDTKTYSMDCFASRNGATNRTVNYTIAGVTKVLDIGGNTSRIVSFTGLKSNSGSITIQDGPASGSSAAYGYFGALVITEYNS